MEIVFQTNDKWYLGTIYVSQSSITLTGQKQIKNIKVVRDIDNYIHISEHIKRAPVDTRIIGYMKRCCIDDMYVKTLVPKKGICNLCINKCKSDIVLSCNSFKEIKKGNGRCK